MSSKSWREVDESLRKWGADGQLDFFRRASIKSSRIEIPIADYSDRTDDVIHRGFGMVDDLRISV